MKKKPSISKSWILVSVVALLFISLPYSVPHTSKASGKIKSLSMTIDPANTNQVGSMILNQPHALTSINRGFRSTSGLQSQTSSSQSNLSSAIGGFRIAFNLNFNSTPNTTFNLDILFSPTCTTGPQVIGSIPVLLDRVLMTTDANGNTNYSYSTISPFPPSLSEGFISILVASPNGNTSEISNCLRIVFPQSLNLREVESKIEPTSTTDDIATPAVTISGIFFGEPTTSYKLNFFYTPNASGTGCSNQGRQFLNQTPVTIKTDEKGQRAFTFPIASSLSSGFINCMATGPTGVVSEVSNCVSIISPSCPPKVSPTTSTIGSKGGEGNVDVSALLSCKAVTAQSNAEWITINSITPRTDTSPIGSVQYSVAKNTTGGLRIGTITVSGQTVTIFQQITDSNDQLIPKIISTQRQGKNLLISGEGFNSGAKILMNGEPQKTIYESALQLIGKKLGKWIRTGDKIQIVNPDGTYSNEIIY